MWQLCCPKDTNVIWFAALTQQIWEECGEKRQGLNERNKNDAVGEEKGIIRS